MSFRAAVLEALRSALGEQAEAVGDLDRMLSAPPKPEMGDLAFGCFPLAKILRAPPPAIAADLAGRMQAGGAIAEVRALGPFVNFFANPTAMLDQLARDVDSGAFFEGLHTDTPRRIMVEFSQPNTHKTFHVGHLRNVVLGDALARVLAARGHDVVPVNYYGDFGIDVAKCLWWLRTHETGEAPATGRTAWLGRAYSAANEAITLHEDDAEATKAKREEQRAEVREVLRGLEDGEAEITALYQQTRQWCLDEFADVYRWLGVHFEHDFFESQLEEPAQKVVDEYLEKGVFEESQGAIICDLEEQKLIPALVRKSDGASLYMTWDLALAKRKFDQFGVEQSLYVVDAGQSLHFQQLFATLGHMGYERAKDCRHVSYELVMLPDGKMSSRKGTATPFHELRANVVAAIRAKMQDQERRAAVGLEEIDEDAVAHRVAVACLKYGMLRSGNTRRVVYQLEDWINPEGETGAYLMYGLARIGGILRKTDETVDLAAGVEAGGQFGEEAERALMGHLLKLGDVLARVENGLDPSPLAAWCYEGTRAFSRFYRECPVLKADEQTRRARLVLIRAAQTVLIRGLSLLGIEAVTAM